MKKLLLLATLVLAGCAATVKPWQREKLSHPAMTPDARVEEGRATLHMIGAREGSTGAAGETGGGCGCN